MCSLRAHTCFAGQRAAPVTSTSIAFLTPMDRLYPAPRSISGECVEGDRASGLDHGRCDRSWRRTAYDTARGWTPPARCLRALSDAAKGPAPVDGSTSDPKLPSGCPKFKPGLTAFAAGARVVLALTSGSPDTPSDVEPSSLGHVGSAAEARDALVLQNNTGGVELLRAELSLRYLVSYEGMGVAEISCLRGCYCRRTRLDAARNSSRTSLWEPWWQRVRIESLPGPAGNVHCLVAIEVLRETSSGGHKFKLGGINLRWGSTSCHMQSRARSRDRFPSRRSRVGLEKG